jgi:hypothetical protein
MDQIGAMFLLSLQHDFTESRGVLPLLLGCDSLIFLND